MGPGIRETEEKQRYPIQVDEKDLEKLLSLLEGVSNASSSPQIVVTQCQVQRKPIDIGGEVYELELELLKREWQDEEAP